MAKRKKSKGDAIGMSATSSGGSGRLSTDITDVENGYVINVSGETGGKESKYFNKRYISPTREGALVIAASHLGGSTKGGKRKGSAKKKLMLKRG
jgi:hypothetical protein